MDFSHTPVLFKEAIGFLKVQLGKKYIDTTVGGGGHAEAILQAGGVLLGLDQDPQALEIAKRRLASACPPDVYLRGRLVHGNFANLKSLAEKENFCQVAGILFDLGISTIQLKDPSRGFSFGVNTALDMRMNPKEQEVTAADLVNGLNEGELYELFTKLGEEHYSRPVARAICRARRVRQIKTCGELANLVREAVPRREKFARTHPATRIFQALRIAVNDELNCLRVALPQASELLETGGRLVVLSFHSLEDRIVKEFLESEAERKRMIILTKKVVKPTTEEIKDNSSARSAKLRAGEKNEKG